MTYYVPDGNFYHYFNLIGISEDKKTHDPYDSKHTVFYDTFTFDLNIRNNFFEIIDKRKKQNLSSEIVYEYSYEGGLGYNDLKDYIQFLRNRNFSLDNVKFIFNLNQTDIRQQLNEQSLQIHNVDMFSASVLRHTEAGINQFTTKPLIYRDTRINFLAAQLFQKKSRLEALHLLYQKGLIQNAIKGILITPEELERNKDKINDSNFYAWLSNNLGPADHVNVHKIPTTQLYTACNGNPYSTHIYDQSRVSYICETLCEVHAVPDNFITEKTYRPIFNRSPFVLQGSYGQLDFLESIGINTYQKYTGQHYKNKSNYVQSVVDAAQELLLCTIKYPYDIDNIAEKNQNRINQYAKHQLEGVKAFLGATNEKVRSKRVRNPFK